MSSRKHRFGKESLTNSSLILRSEYAIYKKMNETIINIMSNLHSKNMTECQRTRNDFCKYILD